MKGLLKSNLLSVCSNIKVFSAIMLILGVIAAAAINPTFLIAYVLLCMAGFSVIPAAGVKRDFAAKWGKYKLTLPVKRAYIVKSCYVSQLIWLIVGAVFAGVSVSLSWLLHGCPFDNSIDTLSVFALGISANLFTAAFFFPMFYLAGEEKRRGNFNHQPALRDWYFAGDNQYPQPFPDARTCRHSDRVGCFSRVLDGGVCFVVPAGG